MACRELNDRGRRPAGPSLAGRTGRGGGGRVAGGLGALLLWLTLGVEGRAWADRPAPLPGPAGPLWFGPLPPGADERLIVVLQPDSGRLYIEVLDSKRRAWRYEEGVGWVPPAELSAPPAPLPLILEVAALGVDPVLPSVDLAGADWDGSRLEALIGPSGDRLRFLNDPSGRPEGVLWPDGERLRWIWGPQGVERFDGRRALQGSVRRDNGFQYVNVVGSASVRWGAPAPPRAVAEAPAPPPSADPLEARLITIALTDTPADRPGEAPPLPAAPPAGWVQITDAVGQQVQARRDADGRWVELSDPRGLRTQLVAEGERLRVITAGGESWSLRLDPRGLPVEVQSPGGRTWAYQRDEAGRPLRAVDPVGGATEWRRDAEGRVVEVRWGSESTRLERDPAGRLSAVVGPTGARARLVRDAAGQVEAVIDPAGAKIGLSWDGAGHLIGLTAPDGGEWGIGRDSLGRLDALLWPSGEAVRFDRNGEGRVDLVVRDGWGSLRIRRGSDGAPSELEDGEGRKTGLLRDAAGRVRMIRRPDGSVLSVERDPRGELVAVVSERGVVRIPRDPLGRPLAAGPVRWQWDSDGGLSGLRVGGVDLRLDRDAAGRIAGLHSGTWAASVTRDPRGLPVRWLSPDGELRLIRDARGLPTAEEGPFGTVSYVRDVRGMLSRLINPEGEWVWSRDALGRPLRVQTAGLSVGFDWDPDGRLALQRLPSGALQTFAWAQNVVEEAILGVDGRPTSRRSVALDLQARPRWAQVNEQPREQWRYDPLGGLVAVEQGDSALWSITPSGVAGPGGFSLINDRLGRPAELRSGPTLPLFGVGGGAAVLERDAAGRVVGARGEQGELALAWAGPGWLSGAAGPVGEWSLRRDPRGWPAELAGPDGIAALRFMPLGEGEGSGGLLVSGAQLQRRWAPGPAGPVAWVDERGAGGTLRQFGGGGQALEGASAPLWVLEGPVGGPDSAALGPAVAPATVRMFPGGPIVGLGGAWEPLTGARLDGLSPPPWSLTASPALGSWGADPAAFAPTSAWSDPLRLLSALGLLGAEPAEGSWVRLQPDAVAYEFLPASADRSPQPTGPPSGSVPIDEHPVVVALLEGQLHGRVALDLERMLLRLAAEEVGAADWTEVWVPGLEVPGQDILALRPKAPWPLPP